MANVRVYIGMCCNMTTLLIPVILLKIYIVIQLLPSGSIKQGYRLDHVTRASGLYI